MGNLLRLSCALLLVVSSVCGASIIEQVHNFGGVPNLSGAGTFNQFDTEGGILILQSVEVELYLAVTQYTLVLDNESYVDATGDFEFGYQGLLSSTDVFLGFDASVGAIDQGTAVLGPHDDDDDIQMADDGDGPDGATYIFGNISDSNSGAVSPAYHFQYEGLGTYDIDYNVSQWDSINFASGISKGISPLTANGYVKVTYNYIPEPATLSLLGLGLLGLVRRRKR